jgi:3-isopropylmalate/(R)-2-methylmalate dehydratase large subunit
MEDTQMGQTMTEKILARASNQPNAKAGEVVTAKIDLAMVTDGYGPLFYQPFRELNVPIWDPDRVFIVIDHVAPASSLSQAEWLSGNYHFVKDYNLKNFFNVQGISHQILVEGGFVKPGMLAVGTDSHTCTYGALGAFSTGIGATEMCSVFATGELWFRIPETIKVTITGELPPSVMSKDIALKLLRIIGTNGASYKTIEFCGETVDQMTIESRMTLCNMAIEAGAKNGVIAPDEKTAAFLTFAGVDPAEIQDIRSDPDAAYCQKIHIDASQLSPQVALPHSPANAVPVEEAVGIPVTQVLIGSCANGRVEDFKAAADIIRNRKIPRFVKFLILPASNRVLSDIIRLGYMQDFVDAGCIPLNANCGPCAGFHEGLLYEGEACIGTHSRNFRGRMGSLHSNIYLSSPATAAATAVTGVITDPRTLDPKVPV